MKALAIIPARGGSKGVPRKNIRLLEDKPLIAYTIETALRCEKIDRVIVSTDDEEIRSVAKQFGAEAPFLRPAEFAQDDTPDRPYLIHALEWLRNNDTYVPDEVLLLRPTSPFRMVEHIEQVLALMESTKADSVRTVTLAEGVHHPYWMYHLDNESKASPLIKGIEIEQYYRRQLLPPAYRLNGLVDCIKSEIILHHKRLYGDDMRLLPTPVKVSHDIDTEDDFVICEALMKRYAKSN